eukprot:4187899-Amphidinium_carterae.1
MHELTAESHHKGTSITTESGWRANKSGQVEIEHNAQSSFLMHILSPRAEARNQVYALATLTSKLWTVDCPSEPSIRQVLSDSRDKIPVRHLKGLARFEGRAVPYACDVKLGLAAACSVTWSTFDS